MKRLDVLLLILGGLLLVASLLMLPTLLAPHPDPQQVMASAGLFGGGAIVLAGGFYLRARTLMRRLEKLTTEQAQGAVKCSVCQTMAAIVVCRMHEVKLCAACIGRHDLVQLCSYVSMASATQKRPGDRGGRVRPIGRAH